MIRLILLLLFVSTLEAAQWDANNYPNPTTPTGAKSCGLRSAGNLCDPDGVLTESERYRVNHELSRLESKTYQEFGRDFCEKKGLTTILALAKNVKGGTESDVRRMATELRQVWGLDQQCNKGLVIVVSIDDRKFWVSRDSKVPVYAGEFSEILNAQTPVFRQKDYQQALLNIIQQTADKTLSKQGQVPMPSDDAGTRPGGPSIIPSGRKDPAGGGGLPSLPSIPIWLILLIVGIVIPTLICCCCLYFCCCRSKNSGGTRRQGPTDIDPEAPRPTVGGGTAGGGFDRFRGMLGGMGGGLLSNWLVNRFRGGGGAGPSAPPYNSDYPAPTGPGGFPPNPSGPMDRGGYVPPRPVAEEGKGLYPSKEVRDEGAGGSW